MNTTLAFIPRRYLSIYVFGHCNPVQFMQRLSCMCCQIYIVLFPSVNGMSYSLVVDI